MKIIGILLVGLLLVCQLDNILSFPKHCIPKMKGGKSSDHSGRDKGALGLFSKLAIVTASIVGSYWAITSVFFPSSSNMVQFDTVEDIPAIYFREKRELPVNVVKVIDGDTFRVRHLAKKSSLSFHGSLKDHTFPVRLAAVDAPEIAKRGLPGQPLSDEAKKFVQDKVLHKDVTLKLLGKDQYNRVLGLVRYNEKSGERDLSEELLKKGLATVYRQGGARYDGSLSRWTDLERTAQQQRKGIWMNGIENVQLPSEYKRAMKGGEASRSRFSYNLP